MEPLNYCDLCNLAFPTRTVWGHMGSEQHKMRALQPVNSRIKMISVGLKGCIAQFMYLNEGSGVKMPTEFLSEAGKAFIPHLSVILRSYVSAKVNFELFAQYTLLKEDVRHTNMKSFQSKMTIEAVCSDLHQSFLEHAETIICEMDEFQQIDSGWSLNWILRLEMNVNQYTPLKGSSFLELPAKLRNRRALINVRNNDEFCFKWALLSSFSKNFKRINKCSSYKVNIHDDLIKVSDELTLNFSGLEFPLYPRDIQKFLDLNPKISITLFGYDAEKDQVFGPIFFSKSIKEMHINLLLVEEECNAHYTWAKHLSALITSQSGRNRVKRWVCNMCLNPSSSEQKAINHKELCSGKVATFPNPKDAVLKFRKHQKSLQLPFVVYADFVQPTNAEVSSKSAAFAYYIKCAHDERLSKFVVETGLNSGYNFVDSLTSDLKYIFIRYLSKSVDKIMSPEEELNFQQSKTCHICDGALGSDKVRDHCDMTGKFRGAAHNDCEFKFRNEPLIPVFFHDFSRYDINLFIKDLALIPGDIKLLPFNNKQYISISKILKVCYKRDLEIRFLDSYRFLPHSLDTIANNLDDTQLTTIKSHSKCESQFKLMCRKAVFPYLNSSIKLEEPSLPPTEAFSSNQSEYSEENHIHARNVWNDFSCTTLKDYLELCLKTNVFLLVDVFENLRSLCLRLYFLDPANFYTIPDLSWSAMLKTTKIELELLTDPDMHEFVQSGIRGGLVQCSHPYTLANNKYLSTYDASKESSFLMHLEASNLNDWALSQPLPYGGFQWILKSELQYFDVFSIPTNFEYGFILEVDLEYPYNTHDDHNDLPFCPTIRLATQSAKVKKLIADLCNKKNYIIHHKNLQQCLGYGLKLKKIHRGVRFFQKPWLKSYIDLNTQYRENAKTKFEIDFFNSLNNTVYGKTMENADKKVDVKFMREWEFAGPSSSGGRPKICARSLIAKGNFHSCKLLSENFCAIQMKRANVFYNKPLYLGFVASELAKFKMYDFHYNYMKNKFGENVKLNYMDADSFIYTIKTNDFYDDISDDVKFKRLGLFKDRLNGKPILEFVGLRSKMYSYKVDRAVEQTFEPLKTMKRSAVDKLDFDNYKKILFKIKSECS